MSAIIAETPARRQASSDGLLGAATAVALRELQPRARVVAEVVRRWAAAGGDPVELRQTDLARTCDCSLRTVERAMAYLRSRVEAGARLFVEAAGRRVAPRLTPAGEWESSPKRWSLSRSTVWAALGLRPRAADDPTRPPRPGPTPPRRRVAPGQFRPPPLPVPIREVDVISAPTGPTAAGRALIAAIRTAHRW